MSPMVPELEAYQARLEDRARAWDETGDEALDADLTRCEAQVRLLEKGIAEFSAALTAIPGDQVEQRRRASHRVEVLQQTRDLTAAYAEVLRGYIGRRGRA